MKEEIRDSEFYSKSAAQFEFEREHEHEWVSVHWVEEPWQFCIVKGCTVTRKTLTY